LLSLGGNDSHSEDRILLSGFRYKQVILLVGAERFERPAPLRQSRFQPPAELDCFQIT
jgi:hypothetical protein